MDTAVTEVEEFDWPRLNLDDPVEVPEPSRRLRPLTRAGARVLSGGILGAVVEGLPPGPLREERLDESVQTLREPFTLLRECLVESITPTSEGAELVLRLPTRIVHATGTLQDDVWEGQVVSVLLLEDGTLSVKPRTTERDTA